MNWPGVRVSVLRWWQDRRGGVRPLAVIAAEPTCDLPASHDAQGFSFQWQFADIRRSGVPPSAKSTSPARPALRLVCLFHVAETASDSIVSGIAAQLRSAVLRFDRLCRVRATASPGAEFLPLDRTAAESAATRRILLLKLRIGAQVSR